MRLIDKDPPPPTGDAKTDMDAQYRYLCYLREQLNFIITNLEREVERNA